MKLFDKIFITGADGFIGSHLVELLLEYEYKVKALVQYNSFNTWGWLDNSIKKNHKNLEIVSGDIRDSFFLKKEIEGCDSIIHLAALIAIPYSYKSPNSYIESNVIGTLNILNASLELNIKRILITSTSEVYGTAMKVPIDENHKKQPQSPYSASKVAADAISEAYYRSFDLPVSIVRPFNTYGPRQSARAIIPSVIIQLLNGAKKLKLGDLTPTRDLLYVNDTVLGFKSILECEELIGSEVNISTQSEISILDLVKLIQSKLGNKSEIISDKKRLRPKNSEVYRLLGSNHKIKSYTKWQPKVSLECGLDKTIEWFSDKRNLSFYKQDLYNV